MNPRIPVVFACVTFTCFTGISPATLATEPVQQPNIVWVTAEDLSPRLGCYGDTLAQTPTLDQLASEGHRYTRAFATYGVCAPARHSIITGMYPATNGAGGMRTWKHSSAVTDPNDPLLKKFPTYEATPAPEVKCFTEYLRAAGYYCTNRSKEDYQFRAPITAWDESSGQAHWRNRPRPDTPFFAVFNYFQTHESQTHQQKVDEFTDPAAVDVPPYYPDTPTVRKVMARHYDNIRHLDQQVGKLIQELQRDGLYDQTYIFFYGDHGDGFIRAKRWVYDSGIRVPFLIRLPGGKGAGVVQDRLISFVDLAPTVLSLAGIPIPDHMQGQAFLGAQAASPRTYIHAARDRMDVALDTIRSVHDGRYQYVRNYQPDTPYVQRIPYRDRSEMAQDILKIAAEGKLGPDQWQLSRQTKPQEELYDTQSDPHEINNRADDPALADKLVELRAAHQAWTETTRDLGHLSEFDLVKKLWPPAGAQPTTASPTISSSSGLVSIHCETVGASIGYRIGDEIRWRLYSAPFQADPHQKITAQAHRLGWLKSKNAVESVN